MRHFTIKIVMTAVLLVASAGLAPLMAEVTLPAMFSDHMVLQRDMPVAVWGWADPGETITVIVADQQSEATADEKGRWSAKLKPLSVGDPLTMLVRGADSGIVISDVNVGEVWLCSGQSNMAMTVNRVTNAEQEAASANYSKIRMFKVNSGHALEPQDRCVGDWSMCSPETVNAFSATAYFFGRSLHKELDIPIGLINSSVGGTSIESWTSMPAQGAVPAIKPRLDAWKQVDADFDADAAKVRFEKAMEQWEKRRAKAKEAGKPAPRRPRQSAQPHQDRNYPSNLFNGKINPLIPYTIRGAIWYQGENSSGRGFAHLYHDQLKTLIADWRDRWGQGDFPFAWVQLPNFKQPQEQPDETSGWVLVQEGMLKTLCVANTGMAVTIDIGEANDIHPRNKQDVGKRLAQWALASVHGEDIAPTGPIYRSCTRDGNRIVIDFDHACGGLVAKGGEDLKGFVIADKDRKFVWADAKIEGETVIVSSPDVPEPASVRYAWAANPICNLYSKAGLPASPFRTDDWDESANQ